jgi:iron complex outermembrane receptor protein
MDARLTWQEPTYKFYLKANNLFNATYRDYGLVPQPGLWLIGGITVSL